MELEILIGIVAFLYVSLEAENCVFQARLRKAMDSKVFPWELYAQYLCVWVVIACSILAVGYSKQVIDGGIVAFCLVLLGYCLYCGYEMAGLKIEAHTGYRR